MRRLILAVFVVLLMPLSYANNAVVNLSENVKLQLNLLAKQIPKERILNIQQFKTLYDSVMNGKEKAYLIDVRTDAEFMAGHIAGTDHFRAGQIYKLPDFIKNPDEKIVIFCETKRRAIYAVNQLMSYGYKNVWLYDDGIEGWIKRGYPLVNKFLGKIKVIEYHHPFQGQTFDPYRLRNEI